MVYLNLTNLQKYAYIHKSSQTNWLIKVNYPILLKNLAIFWQKQKKQKGLWRTLQSVTRNQPEKHTSSADDKGSLLVSIS